MVSPHNGVLPQTKTMTRAQYSGTILASPQAHGRPHFFNRYSGLRTSPAAPRDYQFQDSAAAVYRRVRVPETMRSRGEADPPFYPRPGGIDTPWEGWRKPPLESGAMVEPDSAGDIGGPGALRPREWPGPDASVPETTTRSLTARLRRPRYPRFSRLA